MTKGRYSWKEFDKDCNLIVDWVIKNQMLFDGVYGLPRGGLVLAVKLSHKLDIPMTIDVSKITPKTLIVDDISDSGETLFDFKKNTIITLFYHKQTITVPNFTIRRKIKSFIIFPWEQ